MRSPVPHIDAGRGLVAVVLLSFSLLSPASAQVPRTKWDSTAREFLRELIEINTTHSTGSTVTAAEAMAARMRAAGWPAADVTVIENAERKGNLIVRYRGRPGSGLKPILLLSHIDVVEANPEDWTLPPFTFIERDGTFYGRGTADDKDEGAIHLTLLLRMKAEGFVPERDIIVALTADEEGGTQNGVRYLVENHRDLIDAAFAFNEGGGGSVRDGRKIANEVQAAEKMASNFRLEVTNPGGHSSQPVKDNAITHLAEALVKVGAFDFPVHLNEVSRAFFEASAPLVSPRMAAAMRAIVADPADAGAARILSEDRFYNSVLRTTCVATMLDGGHAQNALPQRAGANVNCRIAPHETGEEVLATLTRVVDNPQVTVRAVRLPRISPPSPLPAELRNTIQQVTNQLWPGVPVVPRMSTGATDGLYLRNAGIPVYGVSGLFYTDTFSHGMNERISAQAFYEGLEFMYRLVKAVTGPGIS